MAVNDEIYKNLEVYGGSTINERVYNYLGSLGYTGTISDRLAKYQFEDKKGWQALIARYAGSGWTPAALFAQGQQGAWYEPKPEYLYQDAAGTVPVTADGDPVGLMQDLSGNGNHATQSTSAARPVSPGIAYDGVDDFLSVPIAALTPGQGGVTISAVVKWSGIQSNGSILGIRTPFQRGLGVGSGRLIFSGLNSSGENVSLSSATELPVDQLAVVSFTFNAVTGDYALYENGNQVVTYNDPTGFAYPTSNDLRIGRALASSHYWSGEIGPLVVSSEFVGDDNRERIEQYLANLTGVTL